MACKTGSRSAIDANRCARAQFPGCVHWSMSGMVGPGCHGFIIGHRFGVFSNSLSLATLLGSDVGDGTNPVALHVWALWMWIGLVSYRVLCNEGESLHNAGSRGPKHSDAKLLSFIARDPPKNRRWPTGSPRFGQPTRDNLIGLNSSWSPKSRQPK